MLRSKITQIARFSNMFHLRWHNVLSPLVSAAWFNSFSSCKNIFIRYVERPKAHWCSYDQRCVHVHCYDKMITSLPDDVHENHYILWLSENFAVTMLENVSAPHFLVIHSIVLVYLNTIQSITAFDMNVQRKDVKHVDNPCSAILATILFSQQSSKLVYLLIAHKLDMACWYHWTTFFMCSIRIQTWKKIYSKSIDISAISARWL